MEPHLSVVIPNYNGAALLPRFIPPLAAEMARQAFLCELVVADDASTDDGPAWLERQSFPFPFTLVRNPLNLGFPGNANAGVHAARAEFVLVLNSDVEVPPGSLAPLLAPFEWTPELFATVPYLENPGLGGRDQAWARGNLCRGWLSVSYPSQSGEEPPPSAPPEGIPNLYACGAAMLARRDRFLELGGFDELYRPCYFEDTDLGYRAWKRGWCVRWVPASRMIHHDQQTIGRRYKRTRRALIILRNKWLFLWRNVTDPLPWRTHWALLPRRLLRMTLTDPLSVAAFFAALPRLGEVFARRRREIPLWTRTDRDVMAFWAKDPHD